MTIPREWIRDDLPPGVDVRVPIGNVNHHPSHAYCYAAQERGDGLLWVCDRRAGHWGRHAMYCLVTGEVRAVWDKPHQAQAREGVDLAARRAARALARRVA